MLAFMYGINMLVPAVPAQKLVATKSITATKKGLPIPTGIQETVARSISTNLIAYKIPLLLQPFGMNLLLPAKPLGGLGKHEPS
jgi:hypothetical protein